mmetsp:Transcript_109338/g.348941  ORF Transcript_109338/g.348941 Transcript_109338/m.348941 type:complete len:429 (-) Transcript_109338:397-1683(-)
MSSVSSDTEEVVSASGWPSFLSSYTTEQRVVVQSPRLRIPELVISLVILLYSIFFLQVFKLQMFARAAVECNPYVYLAANMVNVRCETPTEDCVEVVRNRCDLETFPYCAKDPNLNISGCMSPYGMFAAGLHTQFVSTMATRVEQVRSDFQQPWSTNRISRNYVVGAEFVQVGLNHEFNTPGWQRSGMVGLLDSLEGPMCQLPCEDSDGMECNVPRLAPGCNGSDILNLPWADYIPLRVILAAAGLDLDHVQKHLLHSAPVRFWGAGLYIDIEYSDTDHTEFWTKGNLGPTQKFVIRPRPMPGKLQHYYERKVDAILDDEETLSRVIPRDNGVRITVSGHGERIDFGVAHIITSIVVALGTLKVAKLVVDSLLVRLYSVIPGWEWTSVLHTHYTSRSTPDEARLAKIFADVPDPDQRAILLEVAHRGM